ncbi:MAG TPA: FGGY-family carbohydrate kinase [Candidatus Dormibacteraeota bacterium]|nr:FGGY-family carbohydrate kinase [Candidatus Dormibacteraeota bacterium]
MTDLLLTVDLGGSGLRASAVAQGGNVVASAARPTPTHLDLPPLGRRWDPAMLEDALHTAIAGVVSAVAPRRIAAVACTGQRIACAVLDAQGATLYAGPNTDARGLTHGWRVDDAAAGELYERTGRGLALLYAPARLLRLFEDEPDLATRVRHVVGTGEWLAHRLCGEVATDACGAAELLALDVHRNQSWTAVWEQLDLDPGWLPPLGIPGDRLGELTAAAASATGLDPGTPVAVTPPDSMAALLGTGGAHRTCALVLAGSSMPVLLPAAEPRRDATRRTWGTPHPLGGFVCESNAGPTGTGWAWLAERLTGDIAGVTGAGAHALAERLAASAPAAATGALAFAGGASVLDATRPSTFLPRMRVLLWPSEILGAQVGAADLLRAGLEEVAHSARANLEQAEAAAGGPTGDVLLAGGMARSRLFAGILATVLGRPVAVAAETDATAVGAAACAAVAAGWQPDLATAVASPARPAVVIEPDDGTMAIYAEAHRAWRALYAQLESL